MKPLPRPPREPRPPALRHALLLAALATGVMALWLAGVIVWVLPTRDPARVPLWSGVALAFAAYAAVSAAFAFRGARPPLLGPLLTACSLAALGFAAWLTGSAWLAAARGTHFEGYLLLMGVLLAAHAGCALAHAGFTRAVARRVGLG